MQAMNGYKGARRHIRLLGILVGLFAVVAVGMPQVASAETKPREPKQIYLALGDSLAFGYSQKLFNENEKAGDPASAFEHGYVQDYYKAVNVTGRVALVNDGCPGETSESLIGDNKAFLEKLDAAVKGVTGEAPCAYHELGKDPLHHEYGGAGKSQLESALETIAKAATEKKKVKAITLNIGPNDILHYVGNLEAEAKAIVKAKVEAIATKEVEEYVVAKATAEVTAYVTAQITPKITAEIEAFITEKVTPKVTTEIEAFITEKVTPKVTEEIEAFITEKVTPKVTEEVTAFVTEKVTPKVTEEVTAFVTEKVTPKVTEEVTAYVASKVESKVTEEVTAYVTEKVKAEVAEYVESQAGFAAKASAKFKAYLLTNADWVGDYEGWRSLGQDEEEAIATATAEWIEYHAAEYATELVTAGEEAAAEYAAENAAELEKVAAEDGEKYPAEHAAEIGALEKSDGAKDGAEYEAAHAAEVAALETTDGTKDGAEYQAAHGAELAKLGKEDGEKYAVEHAAELKKLGEEDGLKYEGEHLKELEAEGFAYVKKQIEEHVGELFGQILTNITGIVTELKAAAPKAKIIYVGLYDPYGSLLKAGEELKPGFKALAELFNTEAHTLITAKHGFKGCMTDPASVFNPGGATEPEARQKFTNMANTETFEGKADGPDIHPTPLGYEEMAKQIETTCKF